MKGLFQLVFFLVTLSLLSGLPQNDKDQSHEIHIKPVKPGSRVGHNAPPDQNQFQNGRDDKLRNYFPFMSGYDDSLLLKRRPNSSESLSVDHLLRLRPSTTKSPYTTQSLNPEQWHSLLNSHFRTSIQPEYLKFFEWMWATLDNGTIDKNHYYPAMFQDKNFNPPLNPQITADIPIPRGWGQIYMYMKQMEHYRKNPTSPKATTLHSDPYVRRAISRFRRTFPPHYDNYYRWLYKNVEDYSGAKRRADFCDQQGIKEFDFSMLLKSTPFRIPPRHRRYFVMVNDVERLLSSTKHHFWHSTTPDLYHWNQQMDISYLGDHVRTSLKREDFWEQRYQRYYPFTPEPQYDQFYRWFFKENHELNVNERFTAPYPKIIPFAVNPRIHDVTHKNTPYKIPALYTVLFAFLNDAKINNMTTRLSTWPTFNWEELSEITGRTTTPLPTTPPSSAYPLYTLPRERKRLINEFFNVTMDPWYEPFYEWFYRYQNDRKGLKKRMQAYENLTDFDYSHELSKAKYPVPDKHREVWAYVHAIERQLGSTGHHYQPSNPYQWTYKYITEPKLIKDLQYWFPHTTIQERHRSYFKFLLDIMTSPEYHQAIMTEGLNMRTLDYDELLKYTPFELPSMEKNRYAYMAEAKRRLDRKWKLTPTTPTVPTTPMAEGSSSPQSTTKAASTKAPPTSQKSTKPKRLTTTSSITPLTTPEETNVTKEIAERGMLDHILLPQKIVNYFNKDIPAHLENYYRWLYEMEHEYKNNDTRKYNIACEIYDQLDFTRLFKYTPYPIFPDHVYEFVQFREARRLLKAQSHPTTNKPDQPDEPDPKPAMVDWFRFTIPPKYFEFYKWLFKLHLEKEEYGKIVQLSKKLGPPNTEQLLASTPYPIPEAHLNFWAFIKLGFDEYVRNLKDSTVSTSPYQGTEPSGGHRRRRSVNDEDFNHYDHIRSRRSVNEEDFDHHNHIRRCRSIPNNETPTSTADSPTKISSCNFQTGPTPLDSAAYHEKVQNHFSTTIEPKYVPFYHWFYNVTMDEYRAGARQYAACLANIDVKDIEKNLENTPFSVPEKYRKWFGYVNAIESLTSPIKHPKIKTTTIKQAKYVDKLREYFGVDFDEKYDLFHHWFYKLKTDDKLKVNLWKFNSAVELNPGMDLPSTPFPITNSHRGFYSYMINVLNKVDKRTPQTSSHVRIARNVDIANFPSCNSIPSEFASQSKFSSIRCSNIHSIYCSTCESTSQRAKREIHHTTKSSTQHSTYHQHNSTFHQRRRTPQKNKVTTEEQDLIDEIEHYFSTQIPQHFLQFYHWLYEVRQNTKAHEQKEAWTNLITQSGQTLDYKQILENTPFPIPNDQLVYFALVRKKEKQMGSTDHHTKSYIKISPLLSVPPANLSFSYFTAKSTTSPKSELVDLHSDTKEQLESSSTDHHRHRYNTQPNKKEHITTSTTSSTTLSKKEKLESYFMHTIQSEFERYYEWLYDTHLDNEGFLKRKQMASKINGTINYEKLLTRTPFPIPVGEENHFAFLQEMERRLKSTDHHAKWFVQQTDSTTGMPKLDIFDISNNQKQHSQTKSEQKFEAFNKWLREHDMKNDNALKEQFNQIKSHKSHYNFSKLLDETPFPIPTTYLEYFAFVRENERRRKYFSEQAAFRSEKSEQAYAKKQATKSMNLTQSQSELTTEPSTLTTTVQKPEPSKTTSSLHKPVRVTEQYVDSEYSDSRQEDTSTSTAYATKFAQPLVSSSTSLLQKLQNHFVTVIENKYVKYYDWLYKVQNDKQGFKRRSEASRKMNISKHLNLDEELKNTPFPIPPRDEEYFVVIRGIERLMGSTDHHAEWYTKSTDEPQNELNSPPLYTILPKEFLERHFSTKISPIFHKFYDWLYHLELDTVGYDKRHQGIRAHNFRSVHPNALKKTPFPIPPTYAKYFAHVKEIEHLIKSSTHHNDWYLGTVIDNTTETPTNSPASGILTPKLSQWLRTRYTREWNGDPMYEKFFQWLSEVQDNQKGYSIRLNASKCQYGAGGRNKNEKSSYKTPFPIPATYQNYFALVNQLEQLIGSTKHHAKWYETTSQELVVNQKTTKPSYYTIDATTSSAPPMPFIRGSSTTLSSLIIDDERTIDLSGSLPSSSDEHHEFSSNETLPEDVLYLDGHEGKPKTPLEIAEYKSKIDNYFRFTYEPKYCPFYEWLYKMRIEKDIPMLPRIMWHFYKFNETASTPFPIPEDRKHEYSYIKYLEQHDFKTNVPHPTIPTSTIKRRPKITTPQTTKFHVELRKAKSYFPFQWAPQYNEFFTWFYSMIHKKSLRDKTCGKILDTVNFELLYLNNTKFPVPSQYYTEYAMMQYMDGLPEDESAAGDEGIDSQHWRDREAAKKHFYPFRWQPDYDKFYIWLHQMIEKHGKPESTDPEFKQAIDYDRVVQHSSFKIPAYQMHDYLYMKWLDAGKEGSYMNPPYVTAPPSLLVRVNRVDLEERAQDYFNLTENDPHLDYYVWMYEMLQKHDHFNETDPKFFKNINYLKYMKTPPFKIPLGRDKEYCKMRYYDEAFNKDLEKRSFVTQNDEVFHKSVDDNLLKEAKQYFRFGWYPYYNEFYIWFYKKIKQHGVFKKIDTENFKNMNYKAHINVTPFLIPPEYFNDYAYMRQLDQDSYLPVATTPMSPENPSVRRKRHIEDKETPSKPSFKTKTTQLFHKWMNEQYEYHDPYYDKFYEWLIFREDLSPVSGGVTPRRVNPDVIVLQTHSSTPFPIPANFTKYFGWFDDNHTETSTKFDVAVTGDYMDYIENITKPPVEELIKGYYSMDPHLPSLNTKYHDFYDWYVRKYMGQPHEKPTVDGPVFVSPFVPFVEKSSTPFEIPPKFTNYFKWFAGWPQHRRSYRTPDYNFGLGPLQTTPRTWVYFDYNYTTWWPPQEIREREFMSKQPKNFGLPLWKMLLQNKGTSHAPEYDEFYEWFYRKHFEVTHSIEHYSMEEPKLFPKYTPIKYVPKNDTPWKIPWEHTDMMNWVDSDQLPGTTKETDGTLLHPFYLTKFYGTDWMVYDEPTVKRYHSKSTLTKRKWTRTRSTTPMIPESTTQQFSETGSVKRKKRAATPVTNSIPESTSTESQSKRSISSVTPNLEEFDAGPILQIYPTCHLEDLNCIMRIDTEKKTTEFLNFGDFFETNKSASLRHFPYEIPVTTRAAKDNSWKLKLITSTIRLMLNVCNYFSYSIEPHYEYFYQWLCLILHNIKGSMRRHTASLTLTTMVDYEDILLNMPFPVPPTLRYFFACAYTLNDLMQSTAYNKFYTTKPSQPTCSHKLHATLKITPTTPTTSQPHTTLPIQTTFNRISKCRKKRSINPSKILSVENYTSSHSRRPKPDEKFVVFSSNETDIFGNQNIGMMADMQGMGGAMGNYYKAVYEDTFQGEIYRRKYLSQSTSTPTTATSSPVDTHTIPEDQQNLKSSLDHYFSTAIHPKYFEAYKWFHVMKQDKEGYKKRLKTASPVHVDYDLVLKTTPFLLPPHLYNIYAEIREQERAIGSTAHHIPVPIELLSSQIAPKTDPMTSKETKCDMTTPRSERHAEFSSTEYQTTIHKDNGELLTNLENFFKITIDQHYIEFFSWLYELMNYKEDVADENLLDFGPTLDDFDDDISLINTPFPVPPEFTNVFDKIYVHYLKNKNCTAATKRPPRITSSTTFSIPPSPSSNDENSDYSYDTPPPLILDSDSFEQKRVRRAIEVILLPQETTTKRTTKRRTNTTRKFSFKFRSPKSTTINTYDLMVSDIRFKAQHIEEYEKYIKKLGIYFLTTIDPQYVDFFQWYYRRIREVTYTPIPPISHPSGTYSQPFYVPFEYTGMFSSLFHPKQLKEIMTTQFLDHLFEYYDAHPNSKHRGRKIKVRKNFTWPYQKKLQLLEKKKSSSTTPISILLLDTST